MEGATPLSSPLTGKYKHLVLTNPMLSKDSTMVVFQIEDTERNYRIPYDAIEEMAEVPGVLRIDRHVNNVWDYQNGQPHCIISGSTGSGKSSCLIAYLKALKIQEARFAFIDPKWAELTSLGKEMKVPTSHTWEEVMNTMERAVELMKKRQKHSSRQFKAVFLVIEEAGALMMLAPDNKEKQRYLSLLKQLLLMGRSGNVHLISVMQSANATNCGGIELRSQYGVRILLGSPQQEELQFLFSNVETANFGKFAGLSYIEGFGVGRIQTPSRYVK